MTSYSQRFYDGRTAGSHESAAVVAATLQELGLGPFGAVLDVGCGHGEWLGAFGEAGATTLVGLDGAWNEPHHAGSATIDFRSVDLEALGTADAPGSFDIAVCVEVVEHLSPGAGEVVVGVLARSAPLVLFSAAVPGQGGSGHINEQWPSYWVARFAEHGLVPFDLVRPRIWDDERVDHWYRQNLLLFARPDALPGYAASDGPVDLVHPRLLEARRRQPLTTDWAGGTLRAARAALGGLRERLRR